MSDENRELEEEQLISEYGTDAADPLEVQLTGDLLNDVLALSELTEEDLDEAGIVKDSQELQDLFDTILLLAGGLKTSGIRLWLTEGSPSFLQGIASGDARAVQAEASRLLDSPFT